MGLRRLLVVLFFISISVFIFSASLTRKISVNLGIDADVVVMNNLDTSISLYSLSDVDKKVGYLKPADHLKYKYSGSS